MDRYLMPKPDADLPEAIEGVARQIIGAAIEVHKRLGAGHLESHYEKALCVELALRGILFACQVPVRLEYKSHVVGEGRIDLIVADCVVAEIKTVESLLPIHKAQAISYLKITGLKLALLINFNVPVLKNGIKRVILS
jgi:GxxExxY protein